MNKQTYIRLSWQIPVLVFLAASLTPDFPWVSSAIGVWPIWLLSMPLFAFFHEVILNLKTLQHASPIKSAQVLVFNQKKRVGRIAVQKNRQAA